MARLKVFRECSWAGMDPFCCKISEPPRRHSPPSRRRPAGSPSTGMPPLRGKGPEPPRRPKRPLKAPTFCPHSVPRIPANNPELDSAQGNLPTGSKSKNDSKRTAMNNLVEFDQVHQARLTLISASFSSFPHLSSTFPLRLSSERETDERGGRRQIKARLRGLF